ncbi:SPI-6 associated protein [Salmonella enterica subsp. enterica]|nr:SPI-6 associated protein [Salmonella enterica subsp. enterica]
MTGALDQAQKTPWRYGFLNLMRRVDAQLCDTPAGSIWQPRMEKFRLGQTPTMTFAPREIAQVSWQDGRLHLSLYSLGLWGPNGPLPLHYTELALNRSESRHDPTLVHFSNIFSPPLADAVLAGMAQRPVRWWRAGQTGTRPFCVLYRQYQRAGSTGKRRKPAVRSCSPGCLRPSGTRIAQS